MRSTRWVTLGSAAAFCVAFLYFLYRFRIDGLPLASVAASLSLSVGMLCRQLRGFTTRRWLQRSLTSMYWALLSGAGVALILAFRPLAD